MHRITIFLIIVIAILYYLVVYRQNFTVLLSVYTYPRDKMTIRYYYKPSCPYCVQMTPIVKSVTKEMGVPLEMIDTSVIQAPEIYSVPTSIAIYGGKTQEFVGFVDRDQYKAWIMRVYNGK